MRKNLTDRDMLRAAQHRLDDHLATRPATRTEAQEIADRHEALAREYEQTATALRGLRTRTAHERGRGPGAIDAMHADAIEVTKAHQEAGRQESLAARERMHRDAWQRVADGPEGAAWEQTRTELQGRVDHYRSLVQRVA